MSLFSIYWSICVHVFKSSVWLSDWNFIKKNCYIRGKEKGLKDPEYCGFGSSKISNNSGILENKNVENSLNIKMHISHSTSSIAYKNRKPFAFQSGFNKICSHTITMWSFCIGKYHTSKTKFEVRATNTNHS